MQRKPRCRSASPKGSPKGSPKRHASPPKAAPDVRIRFAANTSGRCESPRPMSPRSDAAAAAAEAAPVGLMQSMGNCIGRFCSKGNKTLKPQQPSAVQASAAAAPALMMNTMPTPKQYMTPQLAKELEKRRMAQMKRQRALEERQRELEEQQGALEEQQGALDEQKRNLEEEIIRVDESKREAFEKTLRKDGSHFAIQPCGVCGKMLHMTSNCPLLKPQKQKIEEQQRELAEKRRSLEEQLKELLEEMGHEHADGGGAKTKRRHSKSRSKSKSKKSKSKRARSSKRCKQCGMINCPCPGTTCKCKPIAGWEPGKGFRSHHR